MSEGSPTPGTPNQSSSIATAAPTAQLAATALPAVTATTAILDTKPWVGPTTRGGGKSARLEPGASRSAAAAAEGMVGLQKASDAAGGKLPEVAEYKARTATTALAGSPTSGGNSAPQSPVNDQPPSAIDEQRALARAYSAADLQQLQSQLPQHMRVRDKWWNGDVGRRLRLTCEFPHFIRVAHRGNSLRSRQGRCEVCQLRASAQCVACRVYLCIHEREGLPLCAEEFHTRRSIIRPVNTSHIGRVRVPKGTRTPIGAAAGSAAASAAALAAANNPNATGTQSVVAGSVPGIKTRADDETDTEEEQAEGASDATEE